MTFQKRQINKIPKVKLRDNKWDKAEKWARGHILISILLIVLGALTLKGVVGALNAGAPFSVKQIVLSAVTQEIQTDRYGHTNILLLGVGGEGHDGENLTDTMILASIDQKNKLVPMLSIPRDLYVEPEELGWGTRINGVYQFILDETEDPEHAMDVLVEEVEKVTGIEIQYYAKVDFQGFVDVVDALGGVEVNLEESIYDPYYPSYPESLGGYETFYLEAGPQTLDGNTALKYVRSRKTTSDFDRARRQQEVIASVKDKATSLGILLNPGKLKNLFDAVSNNLETDLSWSEIIYLAGLADRFGTDAVLTEVLNDAANMPGGMLYTPEREYYGGAFVLIPYVSDFSEIHEFTHLFLYNPTIYLEDTSIQILNGTKIEGLAGMIKMQLVRYGFNVVHFGNAANELPEKTTIFANRELTKVGEETMQALTTVIPAEILPEPPPEYTLENFDTDASIIIEIGQDFVDFYNENEDHFYFGFF
ncbi:LCP family protein [Patescibacteria group bacterium]|nr:LCP family protein [Patescibacteria group bacterium]